MATVKASADSVTWGTRVTFRGEGWEPRRPVQVSSALLDGRHTRGRPETGDFDMTLALAPVDGDGNHVTGPVTLTFDDEQGNKVGVTVTLE